MKIFTQAAGSSRNYPTITAGGLFPSHGHCVVFDNRPGQPPPPPERQKHVKPQQFMRFYS